MTARLVGLLSPRHRKWQRTLRSLTLDPDTLAPTVCEPGPRDFIICGSPRTGTTLLAAALFAPPASVVVMEPWDGLRLPPDILFSSLRDEMYRTRHLARGRLDLPALLRDGAVEWRAEGEVATPVAVDADTAVGVKFPAFWRYLPLLPNTKFLVCLRRPSEVLASYATTGGRLAEGLDYDAAFNRRMNAHLRAATDDRALRRVLLYDYIHRAITPHLGDRNVLAVRYERWFEDPDALLAEIAGFLGVDLDVVARHRPTLRRPATPHGCSVDAELLRSHCTTAGSLGYAIDA